MAHLRTAGSRKTEIPVSVAHSSEASAPVPLNFRVPSEFRKEFKVYAAQKGIPMNELVQQAFEALKEKDRG
jgi:hypothetical protein